MSVGGRVKTTVVASPDVTALGIGEAARVAGLEVVATRSFDNLDLDDLDGSSLVISAGDPRVTLRLAAEIRARNALPIALALAHIDIDIVARAQDIGGVSLVPLYVPAQQLASVFRRAPSTVVLDVARDLFPAEYPRACGLTGEQLRLLDFLAAGWSNDEIADAMHISERSVRTQLARLYGSLGAGDRFGAVRRGVQLGIVGTLDGDLGVTELRGERTW